MNRERDIKRFTLLRDNATTEQERHDYELVLNAITNGHKLYRDPYLKGGSNNDRRGT